MAETITYNGVTLEIVRTNAIRREPVYTDDGTQYLYTHWSITVEAIFNPQATSINAQGRSQHSPGLPPAVTDVNVRQRLVSPRKTLILRNGDANVILKSPDNGLRDQKNGPLPSDICSVQRIVGTKSFWVQFGVETWVNECPNNPAILAHRWQAEQNTTEDRFAIRIIRGEGVFNPAFLANEGQVPDQYRQDLFHPVPPFYKRHTCDVVADSDTCTFSYVLIDREMPVFYPPRASQPAGLTRIECTHSAWFQQGGVQQGLTNAAGGIGGIVGGGVGGAIGGVGGFFQGAWSWATGQGGNPVQGFNQGATVGVLTGAGVMADVLPKYYYSCVARAYGDRTSTRGLNNNNAPNASLQNLAIGVAMAKMQIQPTWTTMEMALTHDAAGKMVEFTVTAKHGVERSFADGSVQALTDIVTLAQQRWAQRFFDDFVQVEHLRNGPGGPGNDPTAYPAFPNSRGSRGTSLESVFAQALSDPCQIPPAPPSLAAFTQLPDKTFRGGS